MSKKIHRGIYLEETDRYVEIKNLKSRRRCIHKTIIVFEEQEIMIQA